MNDKLKIIAEYDGWVDSGRKHISLDYGNIYTKKGKYTKRREMFFSEFPYLTSLDWLHPVAIKVMGELEEARRKEISLDTKPVYDIISTYIDMIKQSCTQPPINGEYTKLFDAVADGIDYLNSKNNA
jgi:hypothetical protein